MPVCIILDSPENPDNIGAVARAMKNMAVADLRLVNPSEGWFEKGKKMAVGAADLLSRAGVFPSLKEALADASLVIGTTRRLGARRRAFMEYEDALAKIRESGKKKIAAVVFGKESKGLSNESLRLCDWFTTIPSSPEYPSINLAQSVMIVCFSLYAGKVQAPGYRDLEYVTKEEFENVMASFNRAVEHLEYKPEVAKRIDSTFRAFVKRQGLLKSEGQMIKGISRRIYERALRKFGEGTRSKGA